MVMTVRRRAVHAAVVGTVGAAFAAALQYFIGIPLGNQPDWLGTLASVSALPSAYITFPIRDPLERILHMPLGSGRLAEVVTPFGPAFRVGTEDIALVALGTLVMVALADYLATGLSELFEGRRA